MPTQITQHESDGRITLRVEGELLLDDALLLERLAADIFARNISDELVVDLADLAFLDSESASVLKRLETDTRIVLDGLGIFLQSAIDLAERNTPALD